MGYLANELASADFKPTNQEAEVEKLHEDRLKVLRTQVEVLRSRDLDTFNELLKKRGLPNNCSAVAQAIDDVSIRRRNSNNTRGDGPAATTLAIFLAAVTLAALFGIRRSALWSPSARKPNILLITLDTTRADHVGAYGYVRLTRHVSIGSPPRVFSSNALSRPRPSPFRHTPAFSRRSIGLPRRAEQRQLLPGRQVCNAGDGAARSRVSNGRLHQRVRARSSLRSRPRIRHVERPPRKRRRKHRQRSHERRGDRTALAAEAWIAQAASSSVSAPFFVWLHLYDAHDPYNPPPPFHDAFADSPYDGEIAFDDDLIGSVLDRLDQLGLRSTLVAVVGDHGESLGDHGEMTHSMFVYESALRVPMVLWWPGHLPAGTRVTALARGIDLAPTILDLAAVPPLGAVQGRSLKALIGGRAAGPESAYARRIPAVVHGLGAVAVDSG